MAEGTSIAEIDLATFQTLLAEYPRYLPNTSSLADLEQQRLNTIPRAVRSRDPQHVTKSELVLLMDWKLAHGKFRFQLKKLIAQNEGVTVKSVTIEAFRMSLSSEKDVKRALSALSTLRGVGPATASLLLSVKDQENIPFFSDQLYQWACWNEAEGWAQDIKYSDKSYFEMYPRVQALRERLKAESGSQVSALDVERVAYVLGRRAAGVSPGSEGPVEPPGKERKRKTKAEVSSGEQAANGGTLVGGKGRGKTKSATKRKADEMDGAEEGGSKAAESKGAKSAKAKSRTTAAPTPAPVASAR
ncbi:hypothetical protein LTR53_006113 [Teratosphaeriaceae sp. CCFEE 6253]|nr:hypothetical protein LTR53_006113 [Teratosphaeriaceae sp. CCFEE 6253]